MKWVLVVIGAFAALVALMALIGAMLSRDHVATSSIVVHQPPDSVWKVVSDLGGVAAWWRDVTLVERLPDRDGKPVWRQKAGGWDIGLIVEESQPPRRLVTRIDAPADAAFGGTWTYEIEPAEGGRAATVRVTERGYVNNPIFRFMSRFIFGYYGTQEGYLKALGQKFGETVTPVRGKAS